MIQVHCISYADVNLERSEFRTPLTPTRPKPIETDINTSPQRNLDNSLATQDEEPPKTPEHTALKIVQLEALVRALQGQVRTYKDIFDRLGHICSNVGDGSFKAEEVLDTFNLHINNEYTQ